MQPIPHFLLAIYGRSGYVWHQIEIRSVSITYSQVDLNSELQGFEESRLPTFTAEESAEVAGAFDFLGMNVYSTDLTYPGPGYAGVSWYDDKDTSVADDPKEYVHK